MSVDVDVQQVQLLAWYGVRDSLLGENKVDQDLESAIELAAACEHPNAVWLTGLLAGHDVITPEELRLVFLGCETDPRAVCFASLLAQPAQLAKLLQCAELGDAFAQASVAWRTNGYQRFVWAEKSAMQGERDGFFLLGRCMEDGEGCERSLEHAKENYLTAAKLGDLSGMVRYAKLCDKSDVQRYDWLGKAAEQRILSENLMEEMEEQVRCWNGGGHNARVMFAIGRAFHGHIDFKKRQIFGNSFLFKARLGPATQAIRFYMYRRIVDTWTLVGLRNSVVKDIRKLIGKMLWESKDDLENAKKRKLYMKY
jgi:TPR repeat protein